MIAIDTNVLVRVLVNDDPAQARAAMRLLRSNSVLISRTVLLETAWVLRHAYGLDAVAVTKAFRKVSGVPTIEIEDRDAALQALVWHDAGMDFADALHLAASRAATSFATFDRDLIRRAKKAGATPTVIMP